MSKCYPVIFKPPVFGDADNPEFTQRDARINSDILRCAVEYMEPEYNRFENSFKTGYNWKVTIKDSHDDEPVPHYELEFGEGKIDTACSVVLLTTPYCDNYSTQNRTLDQNPGTYTVEVVGDFDQCRARGLAHAVCVQYEKSLRVHFPDYYILCATKKIQEG